MSDAPSAVRLLSERSVPNGASEGNESSDEAAKSLHFVAPRCLAFPPSRVS
jgi:hypothetical protein